MTPQQMIRDWLDAWDDWDSLHVVTAVYVYRFPRQDPAVHTFPLPPPTGPDTAEHVIAWTAGGAAKAHIKPWHLLGVAYALDSHISVAQGPPAAAAALGLTSDRQRGLTVFYRDIADHDGDPLTLYKLQDTGKVVTGTVVTADGARLTGDFPTCLASFAQGVAAYSNNRSATHN